MKQKRSAIGAILKEISAIHGKAEKDRTDREKQGDFFNVFNTLEICTEEVRLHSAFIAELLNPQGSHGLSHLLLEAFLRKMEIPFDYLDYSKISQNNRERYIGRKTEKEGGRVDIIIEDGKHAVIIENKIYAGDQENQMFRYYNYGKANYKDFRLIYLTLDGHEPDENSLGGYDFSYDCRSYENDILEWLEECVLIAEQKPLVKAVIIQYKELVKQITNKDMDTEYSEQMLDTMMKPENVLAVGEMLSVQEDWFARVLDKYIWEPLKKYANEKGMLYGMDKEYYGESGFWMYRKEWKHYALYVWTERKSDWYNMMVGISYYGEYPKRGKRILKKDYCNCKLECLSGDQNDEWPYGWEYLRDDIMNWWYEITEKIVSGEVVNYVKVKFDEMLREIEEKNLRMP